MVDLEIKTGRSTVINDFSKGDLSRNALKLFETLGYNTGRWTPGWLTGALWNPISSLPSSLWMRSTPGLCWRGSPVK